MEISWLSRLLIGSANNWFRNGVLAPFMNQTVNDKKIILIQKGKTMKKLTNLFTVCLIALFLGVTQLQAQEVLPFPEPPSEVRPEKP